MSQSSQPSPAVVILCGGKSRRMGTDKSLLPFGGSPTMVEYIASRLASVTPRRQMVCVAAQGQQLPALDGVRVVRDRTPDCGPLEGVAAGLAAIAEKHEWAFVTTCDSPLVEPRLAAHLATLAAGHDAAVPYVDDRWQPLTAVYRASLASEIEAQLARGTRRVIDMVESINARRVTPEELHPIDPHLLSIKNCNTMEDYQEMLERL